MTEQSEADKYIKCSKCRCKYINDDEHIKKDFGYNRLEQRFKTCVKCRTYSRHQNKEYRQEHKEEIAERMKEYNKIHYQDNKEYYQECNKQYREKQLNTEVDENQKCCTRCYKIKPLSEYGEYQGMVKIEGTNKVEEAVIPYRSCIACRNKDKERRWGRNE